MKKPAQKLQQQQQQAVIIKWVQNKTTKNIPVIKYNMIYQSKLFSRLSMKKPGKQQRQQQKQDTTTTTTTITTTKQSKL